MKSNFYKEFFLFCGLYNLINGLLAIALFRQIFKYAFDVNYNKSIHELALLNHILVFGFVAIIGIGLIKASKNLEQNKIIILVSAVGKLFAAITWTLTYFKGFGNIIIVIAGSFDSIFAFVFIYFLINSKR